VDETNLDNLKQEKPLMPRLRDVCPCVFSLVVVCLVFSVANSVYAQGATATLSGVVTDQNGAVISGVNIAVVSIAPRPRMMKAFLSSRCFLPATTR